MFSLELLAPAPRRSELSARVSTGLLAIPLVLSLLASAARAQAELFRIEGTGSDLVGSYVCGAGDLNADGFDDVLVTSAGISGYERVRAFSGADGSLLYGVQGGSGCGLGDLDADGFDDFGVAFSSFVVLHSGANGSILDLVLGSTVESGLVGFGSFLRGAGDVDGDGRADFAVAPKQFTVTGPGLVLVLSGADAGVLLRIEEFHPDSRFATSMDAGGDLNGDGVPDVVVGAPFSVGNENPGAVLTYSGANGTFLHAISGTQLFEKFGTSVAHAGDVNADGFGDFIVGAPYFDTQDGNVGRAVVFSGQDGSTLLEFEGRIGGSNMGRVVDGAGDVNGDGHDDVLVWSDLAVLLFSGADGALLHEFTGDPEATGSPFSVEFGLQMAAAGDFNGNGFDDVIIGDQEGYASDGGVAVVHAGALDIAPRYPELCNGDGGDQLGCTDCPCGNNAPAGRLGGCLNSAGTSAWLRARGEPSVSLPADSVLDLRFSLHDALKGTLCVLVSGDAIAPAVPSSPCFGLDSGVQSPLFDGLRCSIQNLRRHGARTTSAGSSNLTGFGAWGGLAAPAAGIAVQGGAFAAGQQRFFQVIHREQPTLGCATGLATSQAVGVTFEP